MSTTTEDDLSRRDHVELIDADGVIHRLDAAEREPARLPIHAGPTAPSTYSEQGTGLSPPVKTFYVPSWLRERSKWIVWRPQDTKKIPLSVVTFKAINTNVKGQGWTLEQAQRVVASKPKLGLGVLLDGDGVVCVDLDDCLTESGTLVEGAQELLDVLKPGYVEISPSGRGLHVFGRSGDCAHKGINTTYKGHKVELYCRERFITFTGRVFPGHRPNNDAQLHGYAELRRLVQANVAVVVGPVDDIADEPPTEETKETKDTEEKKARGGRPTALLENLPSNCHVRGPGERHKRVFQLARWLKSEFPQATPVELRPYVEAWHRKFLDLMGTKAFEESWIDFCSGIDNVNVPYGATLDAIMKSLSPLPDAYRGHGLGDRVDLLLQICIELARRTEDGVFFLCGRSIAPYLDCEYQRVYQFFKALIATNYLVIVSKGRRRRATRYRLVNSDPGSTDRSPVKRCL